MDWQHIGYGFFALLFMVLLFFMIRGQKNLFTKENFVKSMGTFGWLAIFIIAVIAFCVYMLK